MDYRSLQLSTFSSQQKWNGTIYLPINRLMIPSITPWQNLMIYFKYWFIHPDLDSPNNIGFHSSIPEDVEELDAGVADEKEVEVMVVAVVMAVVAEEDVVEGAMVKTHMDFPAGAERSWQSLVYTLHTNVYSSTRSKIIIFKK